jgi:hypothetical protein
VTSGKGTGSARAYERKLQIESFEQLRNNLLVNLREKHYDSVRERFVAGK